MNGQIYLNYYTILLANHKFYSYERQQKLYCTLERGNLDTNYANSKQQNAQMRFRSFVQKPSKAKTINKRWISQNRMPLEA